MLSRRANFPRRAPVSERVFGRAYAEAEHGGVWLAAGLFAIALFLLIVSLSVYEITRPHRAQTLLAAGIASLTDIDQTLEENIPALRENARASSEPSVQVPGYPLPVALSRAEALTADPPTLRALVLERSARIVYFTGFDAFDETGEQDADLLSITNVIRELVGFLTGEAHDRAHLVAVICLVVATLTGAATLALNRRFARFTSFGLALLLPSAAGYVLAWGGGWLIDRFGGEDAFVVDLQIMVQAMLDVPERNFLIAGSVGLIVTVAGWALGLVADRFFPDESRDPVDYDTGPPLPFTAVPGPAPEQADRARGRLTVPGLSALRGRLRAMIGPARPSPPPAPQPRDAEPSSAPDEEP